MGSGSEGSFVSIATQDGGRRTTALYWSAIIASIVVFLCLAPFTKVQLPRLDVFIPLYESAVIIGDAITAVMLWGLFRSLKTWALFWLATTYMLTALMASAHMLTFPGLFAPNGLLGAGSQTTAWLFVIWHGSFVLFVVIYALAKKAKTLVRIRGAVWKSFAGSVAAVVVSAAAVSGANPFLPNVIVDNKLTVLMTSMTSGILALAAVALVLLARLRDRSALDRWLLVATLAAGIEVALSSTLDGGRFYLGFYSGRIYGLVASSLVLWVLLAEQSSLYGRLQTANRVLQATNRQLREGTALKSQFLANMSHEIRTPLNAIIGLSDLSLRLEMSPRLSDYVAKIRDAGLSLLELVNDILDFSKIEAGKLQFEHTGFSLGKVLSNLTDMFGQRAEARGIRYRQEILEGVPNYLVGDPLRLGQVLINLVGNAVKFTRNGEVSLTVAVQQTLPDACVLEFTVRDSGIGISRENLGRLFTAFTQADSSTTRRFGGSGLGLTISKQLVERLGGKLVVTSEPNRGSTFSFSARLDVDLVKENERRVIPSVLNGLRVLAVIETPATRARLQPLLAGYPFEVTFAETGQTAVDALMTGAIHYDLVLVEIWLSRMSGYEILRLVRSHLHPGDSCPVIMVSALGSRQDRDEAREAGADAVLVEPIAASTLADAILRIFGAPGTDGAPVNRFPSPGDAADSLRGQHVLVVEDNEINRLIVTEFLHVYGIETDEAATGSEALKKLLHSPEGRRYRMVLMDIQMPDMDGLTAVQEIRRDNRFARLPIVALSAHAMLEEYEKSLAAGMNDHLTKPIDPTKLFEVLWRYLGTAENAAAAVSPATDGPVANGTSALEIPGVDVAGGLSRVAGNRELYFGLLRTFARERGEHIQAIRGHLVRNDTQSAKEAAHALKGLAANLGITGVAARAGELEAVVAAGDSASAQLAEELADEAAAVIASILRAVPDTGSTETSTPTAFSDETASELLALLQRSDTAAIAFADRNKAAIASVLAEPDLTKFWTALKAYRFAEAHHFVAAGLAARNSREPGA